MNLMEKNLPPVAEKSTVIYRRLLRYLVPYQKRFGLALGAMVLYGATDGVIPFLMKSVLDDIFGDRNEMALKLLPIFLVIFAVFRGITNFFQHYLTDSVGLRVVRDIRNDINSSLLKLSPSFFSSHSSGNLIARMTNDTMLIRTALTDSSAALLRDSIRVIALLGAAFYLDPILGLIAFVGFPIALWPIIRFGKRVRSLSRVGQDQFGGLTGVLQETILGQKVVQAFCMEDHERKKFAAENDRLTLTLERAEKYGSLSSPTNEVIASIAISLVILYGGFSVISGVRTQGQFVAFLTAMFLLYEPLKKLGRVNSRIQAGVSAAERVFEILDVEPEIRDKPTAVEADFRAASIEYKNVSFRYAARQNGFGEQGSEEGWVLRDVDVSVDAGKTLALVGMSGGGKSSLVNLLPRFYDPQQGSIFINGVNIQDYSLKSLRMRISVVSQHTFLFNDTVFQNIAYGRPEASREEVIAASKAAHAHVFIDQLPDGYSTIVGEQGFSLSGGERARIAIARALLKDAPILVLDEATAALDSESEALVQSAIQRLMQGRTVLVIAHRLATIRRADEIAVVVGGRVIERGSHENLLAANGEYAKLYRIQFEETDEPQVVNDSAHGSV